MKNAAAILEVIRSGWSWIGLEPAHIIAANEFGNLIVQATDGKYWRICPEEWSCTIIAADSTEFSRLLDSEDFQLDWQMERLVEIAKKKLGPLPEGRCYCLKIPAIIGGEYDESNFGTITLIEMISFAGDMAFQTKDLPDGAKIELKIID